MRPLARWGRPRRRLYRGAVLSRSMQGSGSGWLIYRGFHRRRGLRILHAYPSCTCCHPRHTVVTTPSPPPSPLLPFRSFLVLPRSNPLVMCAIVSQHIRRAETDLPALRQGLRQLQRDIDALQSEVSGSRGLMRCGVRMSRQRRSLVTVDGCRDAIARARGLGTGVVQPLPVALMLSCWDPQVLQRLPQTVRGMGCEMVGTLKPKTNGKSLEERRCRKDRLANLVGYITVVSGPVAS